MADEIKEVEQEEVKAEEVETESTTDVEETKEASETQDEKKSSVADKVIFWVANAVTLCVCVLLVVFVWLK